MYVILSKQNFYATVAKISALTELICEKMKPYPLATAAGFWSVAELVWVGISPLRCRLLEVLDFSLQVP